MQMQSIDTAQSANEKISRDIVITAFVGLFTGGLFGAPLSIGSYCLLTNIGIKGASRWWTWAAIGIVGVPFSWVLTLAISPYFTHEAESTLFSNIQANIFPSNHTILQYGSVKPQSVIN
jgi:uncharacterized membrane protein